MNKSLLLVLLPALLAIACDDMDVSPEQADGFIKYYTNFPEFKAADVVQINQSGYAILGTAKEDNGETQICLLRTDEFGNTIDSARLYGRSLDDYAYSLEVMDDGGFAILGSSRNPVTEKLEVYFIRTDDTGEVLWSRTIAKTGNVEAKHFEKDDLESFFMAGYCDSVGRGKQVWWFALDKDGNNLRTQKTYGLLGNDEGTHLQILPNGGLVITGYITEGTATKTLILKTNADGALNDIYSFASVGNESGTCIRVEDNNRFYVLSTAKTTVGSEMSLKYVLMSTSHAIEWTENYNLSPNDVSKSMIIRNNSFYLLGTTATTGTNTAISLITTNASGNQTDQSIFGLGSELSSSSFELTSDGGFIVLGTNRHAENNVAITLIKTDYTGSL